MSEPQHYKHYRFRSCGAVLLGWLPVQWRPRGDEASSREGRA